MAEKSDRCYTILKKKQGLKSLSKVNGNWITSFPENKPLKVVGGRHSSVMTIDT